MKQIYLLAILLFFLTSCNVQVEKKWPENNLIKVNEISIQQPKLIKSQGTNQFANIYCGLQDKNGDLWFGTMGEGVYRYDGKSFDQFTVKNGLCNNYVYSIIEDVSGNIWFGTAYGICKYDGKNFTGIPIVITEENSFYTYTLPSNKFTVNQYGAPGIENTVWSIMQDKKGIYWFGTSKGVYCYDGQSFSRFPNNKKIENKDSLYLKMVDCMLQDRNGNIWFCSGMLPGDEGIGCYDGRSLTRLKPFGDGWIRKVIESKDGILYFATRHKGVCLYDGKKFINFTEKAGIDNASVTNIFEDKRGDIWIGTELGSGQLGEDGGVWRYNGKSYNKFSTKDGLIHNGVFCILEDKSANIWFGTRNIGLCRYNGKIFTNFSE